MRPSSMLLVLPATAMALVTPKPDIVARALYPRQSATCTYTCPADGRDGGQAHELVHDGQFVLLLRPGGLRV